MMGEVVIARHADTDWTESGQHTGSTDLPLNAAGRLGAERLGERLGGRAFPTVWCSPLERARETAAIAGFATPQVHAGLAEWDYGDYEGQTTAQIREWRPTWDLWHDGAPGGEDLAAVARRVDHLLGRLPSEGDVLIFSHGHLLRVLTARWLELDPIAGARFLLAPAGVAVLTHERERRVLAGLG